MKRPTLTDLLAQYDKELPSKEDFLQWTESTLKLIIAALDKLEKRVTSAISGIRNGKDGKDGKDGKSIVGPPGPPGAVGRAIFGGKGETGPAGKDGSPDTAEQVRDKLETLQGEDRLDASAIKNLDERVKKLIPAQEQRYMSIPVSRGAVKAYDLSASLDGVTKTFALPTFWRIISVHLSSTPNILRVTTDYTSDASVPSITFTSQIDASTSLSAGQSLIIVYAEP